MSARSCFPCSSKIDGGSAEEVAQAEHMRSQRPTSKRLLIVTPLKLEDRCGKEVRQKKQRFGCRRKTLPIGRESQLLRMKDQPSKTFLNFASIVKNTARKENASESDEIESEIIPL